MIDWFNLAANALWVLGCAVVLAALSYASWEASRDQERMSARLKRPPARAALSIGGMLVFLGLAAVESDLLPRVFYIVLAVLSIILALSALWTMRKAAPPI